MLRSHASQALGLGDLRDGRPLPIPLRREGFKSEHTAKLAGTVALREFLSALAREEANPD
jgi:DNA helicase HerA-like ATPase